mgnify:CR=1 FL=1
MGKETVKRKSETEKTAKTTVTKKKSNYNRLYLIIVVLLVLLIGGSYYFYLTKQHAHYQEQQLTAKIASNQQQIIQLTAELQALSMKQEQFLTQMKNHTFSNRLWVLTEVFYLVQQAQLKLSVEHNVPMTQMLLKTALKQVRQMHSQTLNKLTKALTKDIKDLQAIKAVDLSALMQSFDLLAEHIDALSFGFSTPQALGQEPTEAHKSLAKALHNSWQALRDVVIVQRIDHQLTPLVQQQQLITFKQYLQSLAQQAFWGALHGDANVYHQSLLQMQTALQQYMLPSNKDMKIITMKLEELQKLKIAPELPKELSSLIVVKELQGSRSIAQQGKAK